MLGKIRLASLAVPSATAQAHPLPMVTKGSSKELAGHSGRSRCGLKKALFRKADGDSDMKVSGAAIAVISLLTMPAAAEAKGCIKGAAMGAVAGHVAGHHGKIGAAAGCVVGHHHAAKSQAKHK